MGVGGGGREVEQVGRKEIGKSFCGIITNILSSFGPRLLTVSFSGVRE